MVGVLLLLATGVLLWPSRDAALTRRVRLLAPVAGRAAGPRPARRLRAAHPRHRRRLLTAALGLAVALLLGGVAGTLVGGVLAVTGEVLLRRTGDRGDASSDLSRGLPLACDLLAVCLGTGMPVGAALDAVADVVPGPLQAELERVAGLYRLGAEPTRAWTGAHPVLGPLARAVVRAGESGSSVTGALRAIASDTRAATRADAEAAVRTAGVWVLAPLGACFLPAFVCLGVVPLVLGLAAGVFR